MATLHQQHLGWETWTEDRSRIKPQMLGSDLLAPIPQNNLESAVPARVCARWSHLKHKGGLCCYYQPYTAMLAVEAVTAEDVLVRADREEGNETRVWRKSQKSNAVIKLLIFSLQSNETPVVSIIVNTTSQDCRVLCSHSSMRWCVRYHRMQCNTT